MRHCYILRVFTRGDEGGNHLGVIMDVTSLDGQMMQQIAGELGFSESVFVDWREGGTPAARIFTPTTELPFAGHPLVGAGWVLNSMGPGGPDTIACAIGDIGISFDGEVSWIDVPLGQPVEEVGDSEARARRLALPAPTSMAVVSMPLPYTVIELDDPGAVGAYEPTEELLEGASDGDMLLVWSWTGPDTIKSRFFAPGHGVLEDPATGSAAVALTAVLSARGHAHGDLVIFQGDETGHPSTIRVSWIDGIVRVGGTVRRDETRVLEI